MGAPLDVDDEMIRCLKGKAEPGIEIEDLTVHQTYTITTELQPHEIQFIELKKRY
jgi:xylan 1,4-beta-xylosidase